MTRPGRGRWPIGISMLAGRMVLAAAMALPVSAQRTVRVVGQDGRPLPSVRVDVLGLGELIGSYSTSALGVAELSADRWAEVRRLSLSHLGYETLLVQAGDIPADGVIRMEPEATPIEGFSVEAGQLCPVVDDPRARRLWSDVASRYAADTGSRAWLARFSMYGGTVREAELFRRSDAEGTPYVAAGGPDGAPRAGIAPRAPDARIAVDGYAWAPLAVGSARAIAWEYAKLDRELAHHFASATFGSLHDFAIRNETDATVSLVFCANGDLAGPTIHGTLTLTPGTSFERAEWRFRTSAPDEGAGGFVTFASAPDPAGGRPHLVAAEGMFYRHDGTELPYPDLPRTYTRFGVSGARWSVLPSGDRPCNEGLSFHPDRPESADPDGRSFQSCIARYWR